MAGVVCQRNQGTWKRLGFSQHAFSLVEIALALGVMGFALVAILGMVPVAVESARESREETRATFIACSLIETLQSGDKASAILETSPGIFSAISFPPTTTISRDFAYDAEGVLIGEATAYNYATGGNSPANAAFIARLTLTPQTDKPVHLECRVETPATAAVANRKAYSFVTFLAP